MFAATLPAFVVLFDVQWQMRADRLNRANDEAFRLATLIHSSLADTIDSAGQLLAVIADDRRAYAMDQSCGGWLRSIHPALESISFIAVLDPAGHVVCSSTDALPDLAALGDLARTAVEAGFFSVGHAMEGSSATLGLGLPMAGNTGQVTGIVTAGLKLSWIEQRFRPLIATIAISDRDGAVLARIPSVAHGETPMLASQSRAAGQVAGVTPVSDGVSVTASFSAADLTGDAGNIPAQGALALTISVALALFIGQRIVRAPAALGKAAQSRGQDDFSIGIPASPQAGLGSLAAAFNAMTETLQEQQGELTLLNGALETRVRERTHALLTSNNRLQVEIAERELTESDLRQAHKLQALGQLAGGIAHEFNNLLGALLGSLELLRQRLAPSDPRQMRLIDIALHSVQRGAQLTSQLLAFSRKQQLLPVPTDLNALVGGMSGLLETTLGSAVRIELRLDPALWHAMADVSQFEAALLNLALNARDAMPGGGRVTVMSSNTVIGAEQASSDLAAGDYVSITLADSGIGMTEAVRNRAIEPFFTTKSIGQGSGLGLSQVHGMVSQLGGALRIVSRPHDGTQVTMLLARAAATLPADLDSLLQLTRRPLGPDHAILLIDDDADVREVTAALLEESGFAVVSAADGELGLAALEHEGARIKLVIADYAMPGLTGLEVLQAVQTQRPDIPVVIATGYADFGEIVGEGLSADRILRKPFRARDLLHSVDCALQSYVETPPGA